MLLDGGHVAGPISVLMWVAARDLGFLGSNLMRLRFSHGTKQRYSVSLITSPIRESPTRYRQMTKFWASPRYTPGLSIDIISSIVIGICSLRISCCHVLGRKCRTEFPISGRKPERNTPPRVLSYGLQFSNCGHYCLHLVLVMKFPVPNLLFSSLRLANLSHFALMLAARNKNVFYLCLSLVDWSSE